MMVISTSLNGPLKIGPMVDRFRGVLLYYVCVVPIPNVAISVSVSMYYVCVVQTPNAAIGVSVPMYSKTSLADHLHRSTTSLYQAFYLGPK